MRRDLVPGRHWLVVVGCALVAVAPARARERARGVLLDLTSGVSPGAPAAEGPEKPRTPLEQKLANQVAALHAANDELARALAEVGAANEIELREDVSLLAAEAFPLAAPQDLVRRLVLGRGERDGVRAGAPVLAGEALVGVIAQATRDRSEVRLVQDPTFRIRATAVRSGIDGLLLGTGEPTLVFAPAPSAEGDTGAVLKPGDVLVVSRASTLVGLPAVLGTVRETKRIAGDPATRAIVVPAFQAARLRRVVVAVPKPTLARAK